VADAFTRPRSAATRPSPLDDDWRFKSGELSNLDVFSGRSTKARSWLELSQGQPQPGAPIFTSTTPTLPTRRKQSTDRALADDGRALASLMRHVQRMVPATTPDIIAADYISCASPPQVGTRREPLRVRVFWYVLQPPKSCSTNGRRYWKTWSVVYLTPATGSTVKSNAPEAGSWTPGIPCPHRLESPRRSALRHRDEPPSILESTTATSRFTRKKRRRPVEYANAPRREAKTNPPQVKPLRSSQERQPQPHRPYRTQVKTANNCQHA